MALPIFIGEKMAKHILSCSFGKDSIATALLALQHGEPLDELVYCEVMFNEEISGELPEHNRFIHETAIPYFEQRGIPTRVLRSEKTYLSCFYHVVTRGKTKGMLSGFPLSGRCTIQRDCKLPPIKAYQKALPPDTVQYIGIAADRQKREPERAAREEKIKSLTQQMKALRHEVYICSDIETDAAEVQEKLRQAELAAQEERNEVKQDEQRRRSSRSDGAGSLTGYRSSH